MASIVVTVLANSILISQTIVIVISITAINCTSVTRAKNFPFACTFRIPPK